MGRMEKWGKAMYLIIGRARPNVSGGCCTYCAHARASRQSAYTYFCLGVSRQMWLNTTDPFMLWHHPIFLAVPIAGCPSQFC